MFGYLIIVLGKIDKYNNEFMIVLRFIVVFIKRIMKLVYLDINDNNGKIFLDLWFIKFYKIILRCILYI